MSAVAIALLLFSRLVVFWDDRLDAGVSENWQAAAGLALLASFGLGAWVVLSMAWKYLP